MVTRDKKDAQYKVDARFDENSRPSGERDNKAIRERSVAEVERRRATFACSGAWATYGENHVLKNGSCDYSTRASRLPRLHAQF